MEPLAERSASRNVVESKPGSAPASSPAPEHGAAQAPSLASAPGHEVKLAGRPAVVARPQVGCTVPDGLLTEASLWRARTQQPSGWHTLAPWAFWSIDAARPRVLVELGTHYGFSYFAFAQAIAQLGLEARAFAVDTWEGDMHAGFYDNKVFDDFVACNRALYGTFSTPLRMTFDEALDHIEDDSVDLLHIDGQHYYENISHDFESWRPKLSDRAVVLVHDVDVDWNDFEVHRWWREMQALYPSFTFHQGAGLGMLGVGNNLPPAFAQLFALTDEHEVDCVQRTYSALGHAAQAWVAPETCDADEKAP